MAERREDLRIIKTRMALTNAFFEMLAETTIAGITINELCERSGVRRATFYKHFDDKDDFIVFIIKSIRTHFDKYVWKQEENRAITKDYYYQYADALLSFFINHEAAIKRVITDPMRSAFLNVFIELNYEDTKKRLEASRQSGLQLIASVDVVASMLIGGMSHCVVQWLSKDERCSKEKLLAEISRFIDRMFI